MFRTLGALAITIATALPVAAEPVPGPYPNLVPVSRERFVAAVLAEMGQCTGSWTTFDCPLLVMPDGTTRPTPLHGYTHRGARILTVERITYDPRTFPIRDLPWIVHVVVGE